MFKLILFYEPRLDNYCRIKPTDPPDETGLALCFGVLSFVNFEIREMVSETGIFSLAFLYESLSPSALDHYSTASDFYKDNLI